ncbi:cupin domain-containing protein [Roseomonas sp. F4]
MPAATPFDPLGLPESNATGYPEPYATEARLRWNRKLGDAAGLTQFGVNLTRIAPGGRSSQRHWHLKEDEFVYVLEGEAVLHSDAGERPLRPGMCVGFPAGHTDGHCVLNRSDQDVLLLVVGSRMPGEVAEYPDIDLRIAPGADGTRSFTRKDGTPY